MWAQHGAAAGSTRLPVAMALNLDSLPLLAVGEIEIVLRFPVASVAFQTLQQRLRTCALSQLEQPYPICCLRRLPSRQ
jgi:hypothetical protein